MKKILFFIFIFLIGFNICTAQEKIKVNFDSCVDGDTAKVVLNNDVVKIRFLAVDTPEIKHPAKGEEPYGKKASDFTCNKLKSADKIEIEYDDNSDKTDKYDRHLVWVWIGDYLLQDELIKEGLAEVAYLYGDYKYTDILKDHEQISKANKIGVWSEYTEPNKNYFIIGLIFGGTIILAISGKLTKTKLRKIIKQLKKYGA